MCLSWAIDWSKMLYICLILPNMFSRGILDIVASYLEVFPNHGRLFLEAIA